MNASETNGRSPEALALAGWRAGMSLREISAELYGREEEEACRGGDGAMRARLRLLLAKARQRDGTGDGAGPGDGREADTDPDLP